MTHDPNRLLGLQEKYQCTKLLLKSYGSVVFSVQLTESPDLKKIYPAFFRMFTLYPILLGTVENIDSSNPNWTPIQISSAESFFNLVFQSIPSSSLNTIDKFIQLQCNYVFYPNHNSPLWKLYFLHPSDSSNLYSFILVWNHLIGDATSMLTFFNSFLPLVYSNSNDDEIDSLKLDTLYDFSKIPFNVFPAYDQCNPPIPSYFDLIKKLLSSLFTSSNTISTNNLQTKENINPQTQLILTEFTNVPKLRSKCKLHGVSLHSAIMTALKYALVSNNHSPDHIIFSIPVNSRRYCSPPVPENYIGNYVGCLEETVNSTDYNLYNDLNNFWEIATSYKQFISQNKIQASKLFMYLKYIGTYPQKWIEFFSKKTDSSTVELSDLTTWVFKTTKDLNLQNYIKNAIFAQSINIYGANISVSAITTTHLSLAFSFQKDVYSDSEIQKLAQCTIGFLNTVTM